MPLRTSPCGPPPQWLRTGARPGRQIGPRLVPLLAPLLSLLLLTACTTGQLSPATPAQPSATAAPSSPEPVAAPEPVPAPAPTPTVTPAPEDPARAAAQRLLHFHERVRDLPPAELAREISRQEARLLPAAPAAPATNGAPPAQSLLELALLLAQQRQNGDVARALGLLEPLQRPGAPAATQPLARLLYARLAEQRRLEEQLERQAQALRDLQRRADQLGAQLEALRAIERSLNARPPLPAAPAAPQAGPR